MYRVIETPGRYDRPMRTIICLGLIVGVAGCIAGCNNGNIPTRTVALDPSATTNRLVVNVDDESKISVRENGAILWAKGTPARIDDRGRILDRENKLIAWLRQDNIRLRGGKSIAIRTSQTGEIFLSHKAQRDAGFPVLEARVANDGAIVPGEGRVATMGMEGETSLQNRRLALLLLFMLRNDMLESSTNPGDASGSDGPQEPDPTESDSLELTPPD